MDNSDLGRKILVSGQGGKSSLARALARKLDLSYIELDAIHWLPEWQEISAEEFRSQVQDRLDSSPDGWVVDGNYQGKLQGLVASQAETIVYVEMPWRIWFWRVFWRSMRRGITRRELWNGNRESVLRHLFTTDSMIWFMLKNRNVNEGTRVERVRAWAPGVPMIMLNSRKLLSKFYRDRGLKRD